MKCFIKLQNAARPERATVLSAVSPLTIMLYNVVMVTRLGHILQTIGEATDCSL